MGLFLADIDDFVCDLDSRREEIRRLSPQRNFREGLTKFANQGGLLDLEEIPGAKEVLWRIKDSGHSVKYLTIRSDYWYPPHLGHLHSMFYLTERSFPNDGVYIAGDGKTKKRELASIMPEVYGDNRLMHVKEAMEVGVNTVIWLDTSNGNNGRENNHFRVNNWESIGKALEDIGFIPKP